MCALGNGLGGLDGPEEAGREQTTALASNDSGSSLEWRIDPRVLPTTEVEEEPVPLVATQIEGEGAEADWGPASFVLVSDEPGTVDAGIELVRSGGSPVACDMRRSFDGLSMRAEHIIRCNPFSRHLLVFCNRRGGLLKILDWERDGWAISYKRLEEATFQFPFAETGRKEIAAWDLGLLLERIDLSKGKRRIPYSLLAAASQLTQVNTLVWVKALVTP